MGWIKRGMIGVGGIVVVGVGAVFLLPTERIAGLAADQFTAATGRTLSINGAVRPMFFPTLGVRLENVSVANAAWSDQPVMLSAERIEVGVGASALLGGAVDVERFELIAPVILLERSADGQENWVLSAPVTPAPGGSTSTAAPVDPAAPTSLPEISIALAEIVNGSVTFLDHSADVAHRVTALDATLRLPSLQGRAEAAGSALYNGATITFESAVEGIEALMNGTVVPVSARAEVGGTMAAFDGRMGLQPVGLEGQLTANSGARAELFAALGQAAPDLPAGLGRDRITLDTQITLASEGSVHLREMALGLDANTLRGAVDMVPGAARPKVTATLEATGLDLSGVAGGASGGAGGASAGAGGWSADAIDVSTLGLVDADIGLRTGLVNLGDARLESVSVRVLLDQARAVVSLTPVRAYGGTVTGEIIVNGRSGLSSRVNIVLAGLQTQPFLTEFVDYDRLVGQVDLNVNVLAVGNSMAALMSSLEGSGGLAIGQGELQGLDLGGMLRSLDLNYRGEGARTIFDGVTGRFDVARGVLTTNDLALSAPLLQAQTTGTVNIGAQMLDLLVIPEVLRGEDGGGLSVPVRITGPWASPSFRPDLTRAAVQSLDVDREALEDGAKARLQEKLSEELNVAPETLGDGQSVEDAIKERLEEQVRGALGGLFGNN